jgi:hypothetical protein
MKARNFIIAGLFALPLQVSAESPNIEPGMWESETHITFEGEMPLPDQSDVSQQCITPEDIADGEAFMADAGNDECDITDKSMSSDSMSMTMSCNNQGMSMTMNMNMKFYGDSSEGEITGQMQSPMGPITMRTTVKSRRVSDC